MFLKSIFSQQDVVAAASAGTHPLFAISRFFLVAIYRTIFLFTQVKILIGKISKINLVVVKKFMLTFDIFVSFPILSLEILID